MIVYTSLSSTKICVPFLHNKFIKLYHVAQITSINCQCIFFIFCFFLVTIFSSTQEQTSRTKSIAEHCNLQFFQANLPTCDTCVSSANLSGKQYENYLSGGGFYVSKQQFIRFKPYGRTGGKGSNEAFQRRGC